MILEIAEIHITENTGAEFEAAVRQSVEKYISPTPGYISYELQKSIEQPTRYMLMIIWETLEAHTVSFRESDAYPKHRELVGPFFAMPAQVQHFELCHSSEKH